jgi:hypothetical protein
MGLRSVVLSGRLNVVEAVFGSFVTQASEQHPGAIVFSNHVIELLMTFVVSQTLTIFLCVGFREETYDASSAADF